MTTKTKGGNGGERATPKTTDLYNPNRIDLSGSYPTPQYSHAALQSINPDDRDTCTSKTAISMNLTATVTTGGRWPGGASWLAGNVMIWRGEDDPTDTLTLSKILSSADLSRLHFIADIRNSSERRTTHANFRAGMEARVSKEALETVEASQTPRKWTFDDLNAIKATSKTKIKELQAERSRP